MYQGISTHFRVHRNANNQLRCFEEKEEAEESAFSLPPDVMMAMFRSLASEGKYSRGQ